MRFTLAIGASALALAAALPALAQTDQPAAANPPAAAAQGAPASATAPASSLAVGVPVKDKTGAVIGSIADIKDDASGQTATVKMGDETFAIGAQSFVMQNGAAVINATQAELKAMIANANGGAKPAS